VQEWKCGTGRREKAKLSKVIGEIYLIANRGYESKVVEKVIPERENPATLGTAQILRRREHMKKLVRSVVFAIVVVGSTGASFAANGSGAPAPRQSIVQQFLAFFGL
jgi:hypothetical protein